MSPNNQRNSLNGDIERHVLDRYAGAAHRPDAALCCPPRPYDAELFGLLPQEIIEKDYGCGDPTRFVETGETVVDLGSGAGKACYMLSKKVGAQWKVIGVDFNDAMLALARRHQQDMAGKIGHANVRFVKARIQDMALDLEALEGWLSENPVSLIADLEALEREKHRIRSEAPAVADGSADVIVSDCVLNLVRAEDKTALFDDIFRALRREGGPSSATLSAMSRRPSASGMIPNCGADASPGPLSRASFSNDSNGRVSMESRFSNGARRPGG